MCTYFEINGSLVSAVDYLSFIFCIFFVAACNQASLGVAAIFGPRSPALAGHINSMCNSLEIPHLESRMEPRLDQSNLFSVNLFPETSQLSRAYLELLKHFKWDKFCVMYGDQTGKRKTPFLILHGLHNFVSFPPHSLFM